MSDSEENRSGASSALLNIASAYSDSDSSQENSEDIKPRKSLGSLVENLRAEAKKSESEVAKHSEGQNRINAAPAAHTGDTEKTLSVTKIVRLDSGKVVKISTSSAAKVAEVKHEDSVTKAGSNTSETLVDGNSRSSDSVVTDRHNLRENLSKSASNSTAGATANSGVKAGTDLVDKAEPNAGKELLGDSVLDQVNQDVSTVNEVCSLDTPRYTVKSVNSSSDVNSDVSATTHKTHLPREVSVESTKAEYPKDMGISSTKEGTKLSDEKTAEGKGGSDAAVVGALSKESPDTKLSHAEPTVGNERKTQHADFGVMRSKTWSRGVDSVNDSVCNDNVRGLTENEVEEIVATQGFKVTQSEGSNAAEKTESNALNAYLKSKVEEGERGEGELNRKGIPEVKAHEKSGSNENRFQSNETVGDSVDKLSTAGSVAGSDVNSELDKRTNNLAHKKSAENFCNREVEDSARSQGEESEVKGRPEVRASTRVKVKSPVAGPESSAKKSEAEVHATSPALAKQESGEAQQPTPAPAPAPEAKRTTGPIKLKRNFGCISRASTEQPEKKFRPEPSETARSGGDGPPPPHSDAEAIIPPAKAEVSAQSQSATRPAQQESSAGVQTPSPSLSSLSTASQQQQQSYQSSFTNIINPPQNQVPTFQPLKKSPQPIVQQSTRVTRREEQKRTLPLILRKAEVSASKAKDTLRVEDVPTRCTPKREEVNANLTSKMTNEAEISMGTTSSESQGQSVCAPFSNSSSNQEGSTIGASAYGDMFGSSVVRKDATVPSLPVDSGSDNAQPPPTKDEEPKAPTSFLSQAVPPVEMPTIIIPKKRGRPRKFPLPEPATLVGTWPMMSSNRSTPKSGKRKKTPVKKFKGEGDESDDDDTPKKRYIPRYKKKKKPGEEVESPRCFNKKGRMEVMTEGCKPVTVHQITEYFWPPVSSLSPGEKPEGLMIQEQISEYLGVKSFKRKYPSIKRRPVDMEERNYLQENGYVSENMCDLGLTAVYSADIMEIMYNDFPHKFEEYRRYSREKKMKEQKALREKQAAENMDPRKEALDSAVSWNTEFNKTRKMERPKRSYNYRVLLGEWYERKFDEEYKLAMYLKKKERDSLLLSKVRRLFSNLLKDVQLSLPTKGLAYGGAIQLMAPEVNDFPPWDLRGGGKGLVLAVTLEPEDIDHKQDFEDNLLIVGSPVLRPCVRNSFYVESMEKGKEGQALCYGDVFSLRCAAETEVPLYISVPVLSPYCAVGKSGFPNPRLSFQRGFDARFRVLPLDSKLREELKGSPVSPFEKVLVVHAPVDVPLCVESSFWENSLFSPECEISVRAQVNFKKEYEVCNQWIFIVGSLK